MGNVADGRSRSLAGSIVVVATIVVGVFSMPTAKSSGEVDAALLDTVLIRGIDADSVVRYPGLNILWDYGYGNMILARIPEAIQREIEASGLSVQEMEPAYLLRDGDSPSGGERNAPVRRLADGTSYHIVQFAGPIDGSWLLELERSGMVPLYYVPNFAFMFRATPTTVSRIVSLPFIVDAIEYPAEWKVLAGEDSSPSGVWWLRLQESSNLAVVLDFLLSKGLRVVYVNDLRGLIGVEAQKHEVIEVAAHPAVLSAEPLVEPSLMNDKATSLDGATPLWNSIWSGVGLRGAGQIVSVWDTGLDNAFVDGRANDDLEGRIISVEEHSNTVNPNAPCNADGIEDEFSGHGTHVVGTLLGNGAQSGGLLAGVAPEASLIFHALETSPLPGQSMFCVPAPGGLYSEMVQDYADGARVWSNSWGTIVVGGYSLRTEEIDDFAWDHKDAVVVFAAGNSGSDYDGDGVVNNPSLAQEASAKDIISVGGSENLRGPNFGFANRYRVRTTYNAAYPVDFPSPPIHSDWMATHSDGMAAFASRGPTTDLRIKPDVVAPATWVLSLRPSRADFPETHGAAGWAGAGGYSSRYDPAYQFLLGTSMATPQVSGAAALIREFFIRELGYSGPSSALVKGVLVSLARDMTPGQYGPGENQDVHSRPSVADQGWGRLSLAPLLGVRSSEALWFDDSGSFASAGGAPYERVFSLQPSSSPVSVTMAWTDPPCRAGASLCSMDASVNNLDLEIIVDTGTAQTTYRGNVMLGGWSVPNPATWDSVNNLEVVALPNLGTPATVTVRVWGIEIDTSEGIQPFAVILRASDTTLPTGSLSINGGSPATTNPQVTLTIPAADGIGVRAMRIRNDGPPAVITKATNLQSVHGLDWAASIIAQEPEDPSAFLRYVESDHPYPNQVSTYTWTVEVPTQAPYYFPQAQRVRIGFARIDLAWTYIAPGIAKSDTLEVLDGNGIRATDCTPHYSPSGTIITDCIWYGTEGPFEVQWSSAIPGDTLTVRLMTKGYGSRYGFLGRMYYYETAARPPCSGNYPSIELLGDHARQLHFEYVDVIGGQVTVVDSEGQVLTYNFESPFWTPVLYGQVSVFITNPCLGDGYRIDGQRQFIGYERSATREWTVTEPEGAGFLRVRFQKIRVHPTDSLEVRDGSGALLVTYSGSFDNVWTPTNANVRTLTIRLVSNSDYRTDWGFLADTYDFLDQAWNPWEPFAATKVWPLLDIDGLRTVYVQVRDYAGNILLLQDDIFLDRQNPDRATLTSPMCGGPPVTQERPTFLWTYRDPPPSSGLKWFHFELGTDSGFSDPLSLTVHAHPTTNSFVTPALVPGVPYYWRVKAVDVAGNEALLWSDPPLCLVTIASPSVPSPSGLQIVRVEPSTVRLSWNPVAGAATYRVLESTNRFLAYANWNLLTETALTSFDALGHLHDGQTHFYVIRAVSGAQVSGASTMAVKTERTVTFNPATTNIRYFSLPYRSNYAKASDISNELTASKIDVVGSYNAATQRSVLWFYFRGEWEGTDFLILPGEGLWMSPVSTFSWVTVGTDTFVDLAFAYNPPPQANLNLISIPPTGIYTLASDLVFDIEGSVGPGANVRISEINKWDSATQTLIRYYWTSTGWQGTDFVLAPESSVYFIIKSSFTWRPKLITPEVP